MGGPTTGYSGQCKLCASPNRAQAEKWALLDKVGSKTIANRLRDQFGETIGNVSVWRHMNNHAAPIQEEALRKYAERQVKAPDPQTPQDIDENYIKAVQQIEALAHQNVREAEKLDYIIEVEFLMYKRASELMHIQLHEQNHAPRPLTEFLRSCNTNMTRAIQMKSEVLGTDAESRKADAMMDWIGLMQRAKMS